ncbi:Spy/CpxP family protein refolding chaperone [Gaoshiqia sediminis]|uniref:LTXXQ motif family protein n=1 Tax=Gaoshiqia sediminis TaxID=2986998 RepID=A0AA41YCP9_9BACT|nr:hypothetical protein [Gaoshiqia sediminis]MCW0484148.1 hypothetical protein [Gaoshiqia sediminis]
MKKFFLITVLFLGVFSLAQAQRGTGQRPSQAGGGRPQMDPAERVERQTQRLKEALTLTDEQTVKVKEIYTKYGEKQREAFQKARESGQEMDREKMREQMQANMVQQDNEVKALLTAEQKTKFEAVIKERQERMRNWQQGGGPGGN